MRAARPSGWPRAVRAGVVAVAVVAAGAGCLGPRAQPREWRAGRLREPSLELLLTGLPRAVAQGLLTAEGARVRREVVAVHALRASW
jgi:hypothetical protein